MNDNDDDAGFSDLFNYAKLMAWLCLFAFVGFLLWVSL